MIKEALHGALYTVAAAYLGLSLTACGPDRNRRCQIIYGDTSLNLHDTPYNIYEIQEGDTFFKIAKSNGITSKKLQKFNPGVENPDHIETGGILFIPLEERVVIKGTPSRRRPISW